MFGLVELEGIGRPEKILFLVGLFVVPFAIGWRTRVPRSPLVIAGAVGLVGTYVLSFFLNGPTAEGTALVTSLIGRVGFGWLSFVLLQNALLMRRAVHLLIGSSIVVAGIVVAVSARHGLGLGRLDPRALNTILDPLTLSAFVTANLATIGAILLVGVAASSVTPRRRYGLALAAVAVCGAAYVTFFRRADLLGIPVVLGATIFLGTGEVRRRAVVLGLFIVLAFGGLVAWDATRPESILGVRMTEEFDGGFVGRGDTRIANLLGAAEAVRQSPIVGFGAGRHREAIEPFVAFDEYFLGGFNAFAWLAVEGGVVCALSYLSLLVGMFAASLRWRHLGGDQPWAIVLRCAPALIIQTFLWSMFVNAWDIPLVWFVFGLILAAVEMAELNRAEAAGPQRWRLAVAGRTSRGAVPRKPARNR